MKSNKEIFEDFTKIIVPKLQSVSKRFANSIESVYTESSLEILASPYIMTLVHGRKPTSSNAIAGTPNLQQILLSWIKTKGITPKANDKGHIPTLEQLSFAMSKSMHKKGDKLYQNGGRENFFNEIISDVEINKLLSELSNKYYYELKKSL